MYSLELNRMVAFPAGIAGGSNFSPSWSADGSKVAFSSARTGDSEIWIADASGANPRRVTSFRGPDVAPTWNPRSNAQLAWVSGRTGEPQIYTMEQDGSNVQRITDSGYAVSPSWSPNGQLLAFSWNRKYGPGDPGGVDIHVIDIASKNYIQLTHESGSNDYPFWAPDNRHIVFERTIGGHSQIWSMLADRRNRTASVDPPRKQLHAQLELEVSGSNWTAWSKKLRDAQQGIVPSITLCIKALQQF
jgi:TolB protein